MTADGDTLIWEGRAVDIDGVVRVMGGQRPKDGSGGTQRRGCRT